MNFEPWGIKVPLIEIGSVKFTSGKMNWKSWQDGHPRGNAQWANRNTTEGRKGYGEKFQSHQSLLK